MNDPGELAATLLQKHFPKFGTFRKSCTYKEMDNSSYNTSTGEATEVVLSTNSIEIIFADFTFSQTQAATIQPDGINILESDQNAIFPSLDLPVTPKINDQIVDDNSVVWRVIGRGSDPKPAVYQLHVRPIDG